MDNNETIIKFKPYDVVRFTDEELQFSFDIVVTKYIADGIYEGTRICDGEKMKFHGDAAELREAAAAKETTDHPEYYNRYSVEAVEMARRIWGDQALKTTGEIIAFFYRMRMGLKPDNPVEKELSKEDWWLNYIKTL